MNKKSMLLVGNGSYANRGCEAIVRGTKEIIQKEFGDISFLAGVYGDVDAIAEQQRDEIDDSIESFPLRAHTPRWSPDWFAGQANKRLGTSFAGVHNTLTKHASNAMAALEIGGDNYSLDYGLPAHFMGMDNYLLKQKVPTLIWGASIGPFDSDPEFAPIMFDHLKALDGVLVRETASSEYLEKNGVEENVHVVADPAFVMSAKKPDSSLLGFSIDQGVIGLNFSPLMAKFIDSNLPAVTEINETHLEKWKMFCVDCISSIIKKTDRDVILVPHVESTLLGVDDFSFLNTVAEAASEVVGKPIGCVPNGMNATEMKWVISQCGIFAGARTHSTIAAISTKVPTLSLGYSLKARGINQDVFGCQDYCIGHKDLTVSSFTDYLMAVSNEEVSIKKHLEDRIPEIKEKAYQAGPILRKIVEGLI